MISQSIFAILILVLLATDGIAAQGTYDMDINNDGTVTPVDSLLITNYLNQHGAEVQVSQRAPDRYDVNRDGWVSPLDALLINNFLNRQAEGMQDDPSGQSTQNQLRKKQPGRNISPAQAPRQLR